MKLPAHHACTDSGGFTLVELLVVIGFIITLMSITAPAPRTSRANSVKSGTATFANLLVMARSKAIANRKTVRVVFADANNISTNAGALAYKSYGVLMLTNQPASVTNWIYLDRWLTLPEGAYFPLSTSLSGTTTDMPFPTNSTTPGPGSISYIEFKPSGSVNSSGDLSILIREGTLKGTVVMTSNVNNQITNFIYALTGRVKIKR